MQDYNNSAPVRSTRQESLVTEPGPNDVLLGRGLFAAKYSGNVLYRRLINERRADYRSTSNRTTKTKIAVGILSEIRDVRGGRFLREATPNDEDRGMAHTTPSIATVTSGPWIIVADHECLRKIKHALRELDRRVTSESESEQQPLGSHDDAVSPTRTEPQASSNHTSSSSLVPTNETSHSARTSDILQTLPGLTWLDLLAYARNTAAGHLAYSRQNIMPTLRPSLPLSSSYPTRNHDGTLPRRYDEGIGVIVADTTPAARVPYVGPSPASFPLPTNNSTRFLSPPSIEPSQTGHWLFLLEQLRQQQQQRQRLIASTTFINQSNNNNRRKRSWIETLNHNNNNSVPTTARNQLSTFTSSTHPSVALPDTSTSTGEPNPSITVSAGINPASVLQNSLLSRNNSATMEPSAIGSMLNQLSDTQLQRLLEAAAVNGNPPTFPAVHRRPA